MTDNTVVAAIKGFDRDLTCRGFQYRVGETYTTDAEPVLCKIGFHACTMPMDAWTYYGPCTSAYGDVTLSGAIDSAHDGDSKVASASITVRAELQLPALITRAVQWILDRAKSNTATGNYGHAAATGAYGHAAATGNSGHAAATGYRGHAAATGYRGHAAVSGRNAIAAALADNATAQADTDGWIVLAAWRDEEIVAVRAAKVGGPENIQAGIRYRLTTDGEFKEAAR